MTMCVDVGIVARKEGSMRLYRQGKFVHVTVLTVEEQKVADVMTPERNGYQAVQVAAGQAKIKRTTKAVRGHLAKSGTETARVIKEFRLPDSFDASAYQVGDALPLTRLNQVKHVNVQAVTKGKGFQGGVKRHNFKTQDATHGNSKAHRALGATGQCQDPGRVFKNKKMPGQMGNVVRTVKNLELLAVDEANHCLLVQGAVPGAKGSTVYVMPTTAIDANDSE